MKGVTETSTLTLGDRAPRMTARKHARDLMDMCPARHRRRTFSAGDDVSWVAEGFEGDEIWGMLHCSPEDN
jgi:hypothetical protein